ncbi:flagellar filament capping protein FliD [Polynucleobacter sp. MWH-UH2A]|uniref:flagellar filament capping protein FliD n=1 Tax=Polynucleobacter sp. MWH-UH2A TaxID=1855617 RepID=UPI001BFEA740|nr:flagellar filament capping protein FliD [Polynucleobacter sp. MWH-UH2A]QWD64619.1 flagellar filament capping protein FliD [Polynucleobacter sp. MWH-UH2A]
MAVENRPMDALTAKIAAVQTKISDLGTMKSKVAALQNALTTFEDPSTYNNPSANTSDSTVVTATANSSALIGSVDVSVTQLASQTELVITKSNLANFSSPSDEVLIDPVNGLSVTLGGKTYNTNDTTNPLVSTGASGGTTLSDVKNWLNGLGTNIRADVLQTISANDFVLKITGTQTGLSNAVTVDVGAAGQGLVTTVASAQDAIATIGGVTVHRASNAINDVVNGVTFNLVGESAGTSHTIITIQPGADNSSAMINTLITAYNGVISEYNNLTANAHSLTGSTTTDGDFVNDPAMLSFVNDIKSMFAYGATDTTSVTISGYSATSNDANIDVANGYLQVNSVKYNFSSISQENPTVAQYISWINGLGAGVLASFDGSKIQIINSQSGGTNSIDISGANNPISRSKVSLAGMGMDIQLDGTIQFNVASFQSAASSNLMGKLSKGLKVGFAGGGSSLDSFLKAEIDPTSGWLVKTIASQQSSIADMQKKQADLQEQLNRKQTNYVNQYAALNALLFQLNSTSTSLASALAAVTNINAGK